MNNPSNRSTSFKSATPTGRAGTVPRPEIEKATGGANTSTPSTKLSGIIPERKFVKGVLPRSSSSGTPQEKSQTGREEGSTTVENEAVSISESERSAEKIPSANLRQDVPLNTEQSSISDRQTPIQTLWQPRITTNRQKN